MTSVFRHARMGSLTPRLPQVFGEEPSQKGETWAQSSGLWKQNIMWRVHPDCQIQSCAMY